MLIKLEIENFRSFNGNQIFHTIQRNFKRFSDHVYTFSDNLKLLKTNGIYGGNASGKTNLFKALYFVKMMVEDRNYLNTIDGRNLFIPFRLNNEMETKESCFQVDFISNDVIYSYILRVLKKSNKVTYEKLIKSVEAKNVIVFERITDLENNTNIIFEDNKFKEISEAVSRLTPSSATFLSFEIEFDEDISNAKKWFEEKVKFVFPIYEFGDIAYTLSLKKEYLDLANRIIEFSNTGISKLQIEQIPLDLYLGAENTSKINQITSILEGKKFHAFKDSKGNSCTAIRKSDDTIVVLKLLTIHISEDGSEVIFDLDQESRGVIVLLHLLPSLIMSYGEGVNYFIDEIGASLHPILLREILSQYLTHNIQEAKGQIIFNTHEDFIMDEKILRQDELWLVEKDKKGASIIFPLSDFPNIRFDLNFRKNYLNGKFGGVPFDQKPDKLLFDDNNK